MTRKASRGAPLATVAPRNVISLAARDTRISTPDIAEVQASFIAARYGLDATRARVVAELCWGGR